MRVVVKLSRGGLSIEEFDQSTLDDFLAELNDRDGRLLQLEMNGKPVHVNKDHVISVEVF